MRYLVIIGFVGLYIITMLKPVLPYVDYAINFDYISTELCENKDDKELKCFGKCHLQKEIKKVADEEENPAVPNIKKVAEDYYIPEFNIIKIKALDSNSNLKTDYLSEGVLNGFSKDILDPPKV